MYFSNPPDSIHLGRTIRDAHLLSLEVLSQFSPERKVENNQRHRFSVLPCRPITKVAKMVATTITTIKGQRPVPWPPENPKENRNYCQKLTVKSGWRRVTTIPVLRHLHLVKRCLGGTETFF